MAVSRGRWVLRGVLLAALVAVIGVIVVVYPRRLRAGADLVGIELPFTSPPYVVSASPPRGATAAPAPSGPTAAQPPASAPPAPATASGASVEAASTAGSRVVATQPGAGGGVAAAPPPGAARFDPSSFSLVLQPAYSGFHNPVGLVAPRDGSHDFYVVEKAGVIWRIPGGSGDPKRFLDIRALVLSSGSEQGLLGLAFDPSYHDSGVFYVNFIDLQGNTVVARYHRSAADPEQADPHSAETILHVDQPYANHNGGDLVFGPDGYLWIGLGDGGSGGDPHGNGQNPGVLLGKMLRIDVRSGSPYTIPPDNPFVRQPGARPEVWAIGLRNPWRYSFDRATGDLYIADVGQDTWEEVDFVPAGTPGGLNFGWNILEGDHCYRAGTCNDAGLVRPVGEYDHDQGCSVTGGYVYRGSAQPGLVGAYFFGDYCSGRIWALAREPGGSWTKTLLLQSEARVSSFGEDEDGELYLADMDSGTIFRLTAAPKAAGG